MADEKPQKEAVGLLCPQCGCPDSEVRHTSKQLMRERIRRYRACRNCGKNFRTIETVDHG